ncbi:MAG: hypothetical protein WAV31_00675 [Candidatus Moraniibacteriota bacterium]
MDKNKKVAGFLIGIIAILVMVFFLFSFLNKNKIKTGKSNTGSTQEASEEAKIIGSKTGYLVKMNENTIDFISLQNSESDMSIEEKEKSVESFDIKLIDPVTPVTRGLRENREKAELSDLKMGQEIIIEYYEENKEIVNININEANKK